MTASTADANNDSLYIGTRGDNRTSFQGVFYEILAYNTVLSTTDREKIEGYLAWKWGVKTQLPAAHPFYTVPVTSVAGLVLDSATLTTITLSWNGAIGSTSYTYTVNGTATTPTADNGVQSNKATFGLSLIHI